jgi:hypothetical protein
MNGAFRISARHRGKAAVRRARQRPPLRFNGERSTRHARELRCSWVRTCREYARHRAAPRKASAVARGHCVREVRLPACA